MSKLIKYWEIKENRSYILYVEAFLFAFVGFLIIGGMLYFYKRIEPSLAMFFMSGAALSGGVVLFIMGDVYLRNNVKLEAARKEKFQIENRLNQTMRSHKKESRRVNLEDWDER